MCALCVSLAFIPPIWTSTRLMFNVLVLDFSVWLCPVLYVQRGFYQIVYHCFAMFCLLHCICSVICCRALCIWDAHFNWHVNCRALWPKRHGNHKAVLTDNWSQHNLQGPTKVPIAPKNKKKATFWVNVSHHLTTRLGWSMCPFFGLIHTSHDRNVYIRTNFKIDSHLYLRCIYTFCQIYFLLNIHFVFVVFLPALFVRSVVLHKFLWICVPLPPPLCKSCVFSTYTNIFEHCIHFITSHT